MLPLIPILALVALLGGGGTLLWYNQLTAEEKQKADQIALGYAKDLFGKAVKDLTKEQAGHVARLTSQHFAGRMK